MSLNFPASPPGRRANRALWLFPALLLASWVVYVLRNYDIRACSDPLNWLDFALHLGAEFGVSRFAGGFAIFLAGALALMGPFYVFLANLPVFLAMYLVAAALAERAFAPEERPPRWQVASATWALLLGFDRPLVLNMVNPYRDPLAILLALGALALVAGHAASGGRSLARVVAGGLLLGLACFVRETFVLLLPPLALYAVWSWRADSRIRFWRSAIGFGVGFGIGICPLLVQGMLSTGQAWVPHQSAMTGQLVPGAHFNWSTLSVTAGRTWDYGVDTVGFGLVLFAGSLFLGCRKRNRLVIGLLLPATLIHVGFYAFYWTFVPRYFYTGVVLAIPAVAWALLSAFHGVVSRTPVRHRAALSVAAMGGWSLGVSASLLFSAPDSPRFQVPQARQFAADMNRLLPENSLVFCRRSLCEILRWFAPVRSFPLASLIPGDVPAEAALREALGPHVSGESPVFLLAGGLTTDVALLERLCGLDFISDVSLEPYRLQNWAGMAKARLYAVRAWTPAPMDPPSAEQARHGYVRLDFGLDAVPTALPLLEGEGVALPTLDRPTPRLSKPASIRLPGPMDADEFAAMELRLRSPERGSGDVDVAVAVGEFRATLRLPQDRQWHVFPFPALRPMEQPALHLEASGAIDLHWVDWHIVRPASRLEIDVGGPLDSAYLLDGWNGREKTGDDTVRWTGTTATLFWPCASPHEPRQLRVRHLPRFRPGGFAIRVYCNETEIHAERVETPPAEAAVLTAKIPASLQASTNVIRIETDGWTPGGNDPRRLGLMVDWISIEADPR